MKKTNTNPIADRFRLARKYLRARLNCKSVKKFEGDIFTATDDDIESAAHALGVPLEWLRDGKNPPDWAPELLGSELIAIRTRLGMGREEFAKEIGINPATLHNCELSHQRLGSAATSAAKRFRDGRMTNDDNSILIENVVRRTIKLASGEGLKAVKSLAKVQGETVENVIIAMVKQKV